MSDKSHKSGRYRREASVSSGEEAAGIFIMEKSSVRLLRTLENVKSFTNLRSRDIDSWVSCDWPVVQSPLFASRKTFHTFEDGFEKVGAKPASRANFSNWKHIFIPEDSFKETIYTYSQLQDVIEQRERSRTNYEASSNIRSRAHYQRKHPWILVTTLKAIISNVVSHWCHLQLCTGRFRTLWPALRSQDYVFQVTIWKLLLADNFIICDLLYIPAIYAAKAPISSVLELFSEI